MFHSLKRFWLAWLLLVCSARFSFGFALLGPVNEAYQVPAIGYGVTTVAESVGDVFTTDVGAPKNISQGYRWNTPVVYYAFDAAFIKFFGSNGVAAVDQAMAQYNSLSNYSSYSPNLDEWPYKASRVNFNAQALDLLDLKSQTMELMTEQLGLASPDRYTWGLHDRFLPGGAMCPAYEYLIIQRNYDPVTQVYSSYVNGQLLGYTIIDECPLTVNPIAPIEADAAEYTTDPKNSLSALAAQALDVGQFYTGFTRDDIGGLRYLYAATNVYNEQSESNSLQLVTNTLNTVALTTFDLATFEAQALTNNPIQLLLLYPGLVITSSTNYFTNVVTTNFSFQLVKIPTAPANEVTLQTVVTLTTNLQELFYDTFANVIILHSGGPATETIQQTTVALSPTAPAGTFIFVTNIVSTVVTTPFTNGDFYILPAGECGPDVILNGGAPFLSTLVQTTNVLPVVLLSGTGIPQTFVFNEIATTTNFTYLVNTVDCASNAVALRQGIEHITFVRRDFDALLSSTWDPITNFYNLTAVSNSPITQTFRRVVTRPDILFTISDLAAGPAAIPAASAISRTIPTFNSTLATLAGQPGPGTIEPNVIFTFNDVGPIYGSAGPYFFDTGSTLGVPFAGSSDTNSIFFFQWGSFDGTTNAPTVYPSTSSLASIQSEIYYQITSSAPLPAGAVGQSYVLNGVGLGTNGVQLQASGGQPLSGGGYIWSINTPALPAGLSLSSTGIISGTPTQVGTNSFTVQAVDAGQRTVTKVLSIGITN